LKPINRTCLTLTVLAVSTLSIFTSFVFAEDLLPPACVAATNPVNYGDVVDVPADVRSLVGSYRSDWNFFCSQNVGKTVTLADLYAKAGTVQVAFETGVMDKAIKKFDATKDPDEKRKQADEMQEILFSIYPKFIPAFQGSFYESTFFSPQTAAFEKYVSLGSREDQLFFLNRIPLTDDIWDHPWIDRTWDYGGCYEFGKFDWAGELHKIARLKRELKSEVYLKQLAVYESSLFEPLRSTGEQICSCDRKEAVLKDFQDIAIVLQDESALSSHLSEVRSSISSIQSGKVKIGSEREKHCSGG
jgi:hypothetical protein